MGTTTYGNDSAGARTSKIAGSDNWSYLYDGESRMTRATANGSVVEDNVYDGVGMRVKKIHNGNATYYVYSGPNPIMEYSASDSKYTYYIFAGTKSVAEETNGMKTFYHRDHLGSTRALTDQNGKLVGLCKYDAWGKIESTNEYDAGVINGDFELNDGSGNVLKWASVNDNPILADCTYTLTGGINGSPGIKITRNSSGDTAYWARQNLFVSPDTDYVLTGNFLSGTAQSAKAHAQLVYYDAQGNILKIDDTGQLGYTGTWKAFALSSHSPTNAATMEIRLTEDGDQGMAVFFDGLRLKVPGLAGKYDFTGKREDEGIGLKYFGARFYDPDTARFITQDSYSNLPNDIRILSNNRKKHKYFLIELSRPQLNNQYSYCVNNPIVNIDHDGNVVQYIGLAYMCKIGAGAVIGAIVGVLTRAIIDHIKGEESTQGGLTVSAIRGAIAGAIAVDPTGMLLSILAAAIEEIGWNILEKIIDSLDISPNDKAMLMKLLDQAGTNQQNQAIVHYAMLQYNFGYGQTSFVNASNFHDYGKDWGYDAGYGGTK